MSCRLASVLVAVIHNPSDLSLPGCRVCHIIVDVHTPRQVHLGRRPCADDLNLREIAFETQRTSGAQLANLVNLAASFVGRAGRDEITQADLLQVRNLAGET